MVLQAAASSPRTPDKQKPKQKKGGDDKAVAALQAEVARLKALLSKVLGVEEDVGGDLEAITMRTVGVKNVDVSKELPGVAFPIELFRDRDLRRRRDVEVSQSTTHSISVDD